MYILRHFIEWLLTIDKPGKLPFATIGKIVINLLAAFRKLEIMKKICFIIIFGFASAHLPSQNTIGFEAGYMRSHTSISAYFRTGFTYDLLDVVYVDPNVGSFQAAVTTGLDLGKRFFLSTGFHYSRKGLKEVSVSDSGRTYYVQATQHYAGISMMIEYLYRFKNPKFGVLLETGPQVDFAVGLPNNGALYSGTYSKYLMPFSRFNEVDFSWAVDAGFTYRLGPGDIVVKVSYRYGLSDVIEDTFIVGRSSSFGTTVGYSIRLSK